MLKPVKSGNPCVKIFQFDPFFIYHPPKFVGREFSLKDFYYGISSVAAGTDGIGNKAGLYSISDCKYLRVACLVMFIHYNESAICFNAFR